MKLEILSEQSKTTLWKIENKDTTSSSVNGNRIASVACVPGDGRGEGEGEKGGEKGREGGRGGNLSLSP